ncbi:rod shape-determining protein MreD [Paenibacillus sp. IB182496]|uniref:Rod shape-determining protein MreD n=1 Tax=Paenibacillus sabuli TaxID=2772509 RepID=A0A927BS08_9BACL|nr:rod shape-determining protein MreD [Paenibacillus sabuli]MBD2844615.1 rod shape-determining protein MreD [Paenibacillus sabuli]
MKFRWVLLIMFMLFILEGTLAQWLIPLEWSGRIVPRFTFVFVLYAALYAGRHRALLLGILFGMLQDVVFYGHLIGVHAFTMGLCGYVTGLLLEHRRAPMLASLSVIGIVYLLLESLIYLIYRVFRLTADPYDWVLMQTIMPSFFVNLVFALAVYIPARRWFERIGSLRGAEEDES